MSLTVKHLNGDTTFLLTFSPLERPAYIPPGPQHHAPQGNFTILVDPWLSGSSTMWHPKFLLSKHTIQSSIRHLSEIPEPNVVLVSQEKPDHCHEQTLRQLDPTSPITTILAEPAAAKRIRSYKYFNPAMVHSLRPFSLKNHDSIIRFFIPPIVPGGTPGEATIAFIPAKVDLAGVHNAIGVTYRPPSVYAAPARPFSPYSLRAQAGPSIHQQEPTANLPMTPPDSPTQHGKAFPGQHPGTTTPTSSTPGSNRTHTFSAHNGSGSSSVSSVSSTGHRAHPSERTLSFIYSPHGVDYSLLRDYASSHLVQTAALPLTLLLHSFDRVQNPWWMGGNVAAGLPGGVEIAQNLMAKCWVSAHDEEKDNSGLSVMQVKTRKYNAEEVVEMVRDQCGSTNVVNLGVGQELVLKA